MHDTLPWSCPRLALSSTPRLGESSTSGPASGSPRSASAALESRKSDGCAVRLIRRAD